MTINIDKSGFTLVQRHPRSRDDIWSPIHGDSEQLFHSVKKLYSPDGDPVESDLPFVEMIGDSPIQY
jgi:hypothetical protein